MVMLCYDLLSRQIHPNPNVVMFERQSVTGEPVLQTNEKKIVNFSILTHLHPQNVQNQMKYN